MPTLLPHPLPEPYRSEFTALGVQAVIARQTKSEAQALISKQIDKYEKKMRFEIGIKSTDQEVKK